MLVPLLLSPHRGYCPARVGIALAPRPRPTRSRRRRREDYSAPLGLDGLLVCMDGGLVKSGVR
jgi:hypothetical protein